MVSKLRDLSLDSLFYYDGHYYVRRSSGDDFVYAIDFDNLPCVPSVDDSFSMFSVFDPDLLVDVITAI